ncbi:TcaA NTF2-like domain-containing protein [Aneurinibacillus tyrosinisolvens]|uniref:TcaA NTF2-like domain-containing protein n=1 Tax=Aneurinibacillus tyrosinisolvens TaxID=1443435 RepID=UPI00063FA53E|nr:hypothetical protein [Aneurinibacillus tyrosinisolvens]
MKTKLTVKGMDTENGQVGMLWPSVYEYEVEASNDFASRKAKEKANFLDMVGSYNNDTSKTLTHPVSVQGMFPTLTVYFPEDPGAKVKLNGKELPAGQPSMALMPAPDKAEFRITANVSGQNVQRSVIVNPAQESEVNLQTALNEASDEIAAAQQGVQNTIYTYLNERIGAINYNDFGRISSIMVPNSEIYNYNKDLIARYVAKGIQESLGSYDITNITKVGDGVYKADAYEQVTYYYTDGTQETKDFRFRYTVKYDGSTGIISAREEIK